LQSLHLLSDLVLSYPYGILEMINAGHVL